ncbi:PREDICTED: uncharacterized protein LOC106809442 [Priapulus caudatus]|uniref:Uncharacterized protein LOC106809442 n=1 Tax=Priapulus caudatus TaxID=37621 RepID=A0ABM1E736_PRICU|nr:PREDICTED: uncharacterized protein LOC106809442 [Priapulus caudatus]
MTRCAADVLLEMIYRFNGSVSGASSTTYTSHSQEGDIFTERRAPTLKKKDYSWISKSSSNSKTPGSLLEADEQPSGSGTTSVTPGGDEYTYMMETTGTTGTYTYAYITMSTSDEEFAIETPRREKPEAKTGDLYFISNISHTSMGQFVEYLS